MRKGNEDVWDLVNEVWASGRLRDCPDYAIEAHITWAINDYRRKYHSFGQTKNNKKFLVNNPISIETFRQNDGDLSLRGDLSHDFSFVDCEEFIGNVLFSSKIKHKERLLICEYYYQGLSKKRLAQKYKCTRQNIGQRLKRIIKKLKNMPEAA